MTYAMKPLACDLTRIIHNHMLDDDPRLFFMHFWANNNTATLAQGLKAALDDVEVARP
jgi:hypothetical protein